MTGLLSLRKAAGMSRRELAVALGASEGAIYKWEKGKRQRIQDYRITLRLAEIFKCAPHDVDPTFEIPAEKSLLQQRCEASGLSYGDVGRYCGTTKEAVCKWAHGNNQPSRERLLKLMELFKCSAEELGFSLENTKSIVPVDPPPVEERNRVVLEYLNIIPFVMNRNLTLIQSSKCEYADLWQSLALRLCRAIDTYNPKRGTLKTHAIEALEWELRRQAAISSAHGITHAPRDCFNAVVSMDSLAEAGMQFSA